MIEGHDKKQLMALAPMAKENDRLHRVMEISGKYFTEISDKLRVGDVLLRRKIELEGYVTTSHGPDDQRRAGKHAVQGERSEKHSGWKFKDVCMIAVFSDIRVRDGVKSIRSMTHNRSQPVSSGKRSRRNRVMKRM